MNCEDGHKCFNNGVCKGDGCECKKLPNGEMPTGKYCGKMQNSFCSTGTRGLEKLGAIEKRWCAQLCHCGHKSELPAVSL